MARWDIKKRQRVNKNGTVRTFYEAVAVVGRNPLNGRPKEISRSFDTKRDATAWAKEQVAAADRGIVVERSKMTVAGLLDYWMTHYAVAKGLSPVTLEGYTYTIKNHLVPGLGEIPVQDLKPQHVQGFYTSKLQSGCGVRTVRLCHLRLSQALKFGLKHNMVAANVCDAVEPPAEHHREMDTWTAEQSTALWMPRRRATMARSGWYSSIRACGAAKCWACAGAM
jgi:hypothetical protein